MYPTGYTRGWSAKLLGVEEEVGRLDKEESEDAGGRVVPPVTGVGCMTAVVSGMWELAPRISPPAPAEVGVPVV